MKKFVFATMFAGGTFAAFVATSLMSCSSEDPVGVGGNEGSKGGNAGSATVKLDGSVAKGGAAGTVGPPPTGDANCGSQAMSTERQNADVLLVLDRSGSMNLSMSEDCYCDPALARGSGDPACADTASCTTRWTSLTSAVGQTLTNTTSINWGLKMFSSASGGNSCGVNTGVEVQVAAGSASAIQAEIARTRPGNNTPTAAAITAATNYLKTLQDSNNKVILLSTDGEPNCKAGSRDTAASDLDGAVAAIAAAKAAGFLVYVVGIGPSIPNLDSFAEAGGTGKFYPATSPADLSKALADISVAVATCNFALSQTPPDPNNVAVYLDKSLVKADPENGWSFGPNSQSVILNGTTCDAVMSGKGSRVEVLFGCPGTQPPLTIP